MITDVRINEIALALGNNNKEIENILSLAPEEAVKHFKAKGYDFTLPELLDFAKYVESQVKHADENDELDADALEQVSGGVVFLAAAPLAVAVAVAVVKKIW